MNRAEWDARVELACAFRLCALFGWSDLVRTHLSISVPDTDGHFLTNPFGILFEEITASNLIKVDKNGKKISESAYTVHPSAVMIHSIIHNAKPEFNCILHLHTVEGVAVSMQKHGLLPASQHALTNWFQVRYHNFGGVASEQLRYQNFEPVSSEVAEGELLLKSLGDGAMLIMRNHGTLTVGANVGEAFYRMYRLEQACKYQVAALSGGAELYPISQATQEKTIEHGKRSHSGEAGKNKSDLVWQALKRKLVREDSDYAT